MEFPPSLLVIDNYAFDGCTSLKSVKIPSALIIDTKAFHESQALESVTLPENLGAIGDRAFFGCAVSSIALPPSLHRIGKEAFMYTDIGHVDIPDSVGSVGDLAFQTRRMQSATVGPQTKLDKETFAASVDVVVRRPSLEPERKKGKGGLLSRLFRRSRESQGTNEAMYSVSKWPLRPRLLGGRPGGSHEGAQREVERGSDRHRHTDGGARHGCCLLQPQLLAHCGHGGQAGHVDRHDDAEHDELPRVHEQRDVRYPLGGGQYH